MFGRVVHAKAAGAWGEFECTHDVTDWCSAAFLSTVGKKTEVLARLSTVAGEKGSSDTARDIRGFALKFKTEEGNWDFVGNDLPVFFIRDPIKFPSLNRSHKRHPQTGVADASMFWDFHNHNQEGVHCLMQLFGGRGVPASLRNVNGFGNHTFKFGKPKDGSFKYVKIHFKPDAGIQTLSQEDAVRLAGEEPDYHVKDMFNAIERGNFPTWTMSLQVMDPKDAETYRWNIFDITKVWPHEDYPLIPVGKLTLNRNPENHFAHRTRAQQFVERCEELRRDCSPDAAPTKLLDAHPANHFRRRGREPSVVCVDARDGALVIRGECELDRDRNQVSPVGLIDSKGDRLRLLAHFTLAESDSDGSA